MSFTIIYKLGVHLIALIIAVMVFFTLKSNERTSKDIYRLLKKVLVLFAILIPLLIAGDIYTYYKENTGDSVLEHFFSWQFLLDNPFITIIFSMFVVLVSYYYYIKRKEKTR